MTVPATPAAPAPAPTPADPTAAPAPAPADPATAQPADPTAAPPADPTAAPPADPAAAPPADVEIQDFTLPEGMVLDQDLTGELKVFAKEHGLTQEGAQKVADLGVKMLQKQQDAFAEVRKGWADTSRADKEFGGEKFDENLAAANTALGHFATPEFVKFLNESGLGVHPEMIRAWHRVSKAVSEDKLVLGESTPVPAVVPLEERMYPSMKK